MGSLRGKTWGPPTIYGNWRRGTGILNNELYFGKQVWNRQRFVKDPMAGKRQARLNPKTEWFIENVPDLVKEFITEFQREVKRLLGEQEAMRRQFGRG